MDGQTQISEALMGAMMIEQSAHKGQFQPVTRDGQPTVAAQLMQRAMPPTVPQAAQQAGLAGQIQAMQQQQAQQALMNQAMANQPPAGIEGLNPNIQGYADGGIIGYQGGGSIYDTSRDPLLNAIRESGIGLPEDSRLRQLLNMLPESSRLRQVIDRRREPVPELPVPPQEPPQVEIPIPEISIAGEKGAGGAGAGAAPAARAGIGALPAAAAQAEYEKAFAASDRAKERDVSAEAVGREATGMTAAQRAFMKSQGTDPDLLRTLAEEASRRGEERGRYYDTQAEAARRKAKDEGLKNFLLGARGRGFGDVMASGAQAARGVEAAAETEGQRLMELKFKAQDAAVKDRQLLQKAQFEIDMGQFDKARKTLEEREKNRQTYERSEAQIRAGYGKEIAEYARAIRGQDIQREVGLARTEGRDDLQRVRGLQTLISNLQKDLSDVEKSVRKEDREKAAGLRSQLDVYRRELAGLIGVEASAAPTAPSAASTGAPRARFVGYEK